MKHALMGDLEALELANYFEIGGITGPAFHSIPETQPVRDIKNHLIASLKDLGFREVAPTAGAVPR